MRRGCAAHAPDGCSTGAALGFRMQIVFAAIACIARIARQPCRVRSRVEGWRTRAVRCALSCVA
ncbi:hypothetical protein EXY28_20830 [Burkholderia pseudomallei]|nr:hypothetical protein EXY28_20830 [Burkholderia pseudomallei]